MRTVEFNLEVEPEHIKVRGNAIDSGDSVLDRDYEDSILADLEAGNVWAWVSVKVTASVDGIKCSDYLGACSYASEATFRECDYFLDMKGESLFNLRTEIEGRLRAVEQAEFDLAVERAESTKRNAEYYSHLEGNNDY